MTRKSVLAATTALNGGTPLQRTAKPNAPPGYTLRISCKCNDLVNWQTI